MASKVDIAALQRQLDDRVAELVTLHETGLLTKPDLEHAVQRQREAFQRKLLARLEDDDDPRRRHRRTPSAIERQDAQSRLLGALKHAQETGEWSLLDNAIDDALNAGVPHTNPAVAAAFSFIENQLVDNANKPAAAGSGAAGRGASAGTAGGGGVGGDGDDAAENGGDADELDADGTLRKMFQDHLLSAEEYTQALHRLHEEQRQNDNSGSKSAAGGGGAGAMSTPLQPHKSRASSGVGAPTTTTQQPTLEDMFGEISSMYRKGHISSPDFARASHLLAHDDDALTGSEKKEKRILMEMLKAPPQPIVINHFVNGNNNKAGNTSTSGASPAAAPPPKPHARPRIPVLASAVGAGNGGGAGAGAAPSSPVKHSIAEQALVRQMEDARGGRLTAPFLGRAIDVARRTLPDDHRVLEEARILHSQMKELEVRKVRPRESIVCVRACGLCACVRAVCVRACVRRVCTQCGATSCPVCLRAGTQSQRVSACEREREPPVVGTWVSDET